MKAAAYVEQNRHNLPTTLLELRKLSPPYRRAIFSELSPVAKTRLWVEQLTEFRKVAQLTAEQQVFVDHTLGTVLRPTLYARPRLMTEVERHEFHRRMQKEGRRLFPDPAMRAIFTELGAPLPRHPGLDATRVQLRETRRLVQRREQLRDYVVPESAKCLRLALVRGL